MTERGHRIGNNCNIEPIFYCELMKEIRFLSQQIIESRELTPRNKIHFLLPLLFLNLTSQGLSSEIPAGRQLRIEFQC